MELKPSQAPELNLKQKHKNDAQDLALLIYELFKESERSATIKEDENYDK